MNQKLALRLSISQRICLIDHRDGPQPFFAGGGLPNRNIRATKTLLIELGLLRQIERYYTPRPTALQLTDDGRQTLCFVLGQCADWLAMCECLGKDEPLTISQIFERIQSHSKQPRVPLPCNTVPTTIYSVDAIPQDDTSAKAILRNRKASTNLLDLLVEHSSSISS